MTVSVRLYGDQALVDYLASLPASLVAIILAKFQARASSVSQYIKSDLLNGQLLHRKTGRLANSIVGRVYSSKNRVSLSIASRGDVPYAAIYNSGGKIPSYLIRAKGDHMVFRGARDGKLLALKEVVFPGRDIAPRHYLERGVMDKWEDFMSDLRSALTEASEAGWSIPR